MRQEVSGGNLKISVLGGAGPVTAGWVQGLPDEGPEEGHGFSTQL